MKANLRAVPPDPPPEFFEQPLKTGGGGGTSKPMDPQDLHGRLSKVEGGFTTQQWAVGIVSASMLAAMAIIFGMTLFLWGAVSSLEDKVDALPGAIRQELQDLNATLSQAITASRSSEPPTVVVVPQGALVDPTTTSSTNE